MKFILYKFGNNLGITRTALVRVISELLPNLYKINFTACGFHLGMQGFHWGEGEIFHLKQTHERGGIFCLE